MPWRKKLNFAFDADDFFIKDLIKKDLEDIQFIDTDIDFVKLSRGLLHRKFDLYLCQIQQLLQKLRRLL